MQKAFKYFLLFFAFLLPFFACAPTQKREKAASSKTNSQANELAYFRNKAASLAGCSLEDLDKVIFIESRFNPAATSKSGKYIGLFQFNKKWLVSKGIDTAKIKTCNAYNYQVWSEVYLHPLVYGKLTDWQKVREYQKKPEIVKDSWKKKQ